MEALGNDTMPLLAVFPLMLMLLLLLKRSSCPTSMFPLSD